MKKNYVAPSIQIIEMESPSMICCSYTEKPHQRVYIDQGDFDGCLPVIVVLLITTFSVGAGIFYCFS